MDKDISKPIAKIVQALGVVGFIFGIYVLLRNGSDERYFPAGTILIVFSVLIFSISGWVLQKIKKEPLSPDSPKVFNVYKMIIITIIILWTLWYFADNYLVFIAR